MIVPGSNLLAIAFGAIGQQSVQWRKYVGMTTLADGSKRVTWSNPVTLAGSLQPVDSTLLQQLGLDWSKNYCTFFAPAEFRDPTRDQTGDKITYAGRTYQVIDKSSWFPQDGWEKVICVQVQNA